MAKKIDSYQISYSKTIYTLKDDDHYNNNAIRYQPSVLRQVYGEDRKGSPIPRNYTKS